MKKEKILVTFVNESSFVKRDIEIIKKSYSVSKFRFNSRFKLLLPFIFIQQFFLLFISIFNLKAIVIQSAGYHSFLPVIFGKLFKTPVLIIAIGNESIKLPEINYGIQRKKVLSWFVNFSLKNANLILPVHKSLEFSKYTYTTVKFKKQGIKAFNTAIKTKIVELVNGYNIQKWRIINVKRKDFTFLTVSDTIDETRYYIKGIDLIEALAIKNPHFNFTIVGEKKMAKVFPENIKFVNRVSQNDLITIYNNHKYYLQLSMSEGFPNALCEAMLCGCIPIGSNVAAIPDIINDKGFILKEKSINSLQTIALNLANKNLNSKDVRSQITENFPLERREKELLNHLKNCN